MNTRGPHHYRSVKPALHKLHTSQAYFGGLDYARLKIKDMYEQVRPQLSKSWESIWSDRSLVLKNSKLGCSVKIAFNNEVFIDRRVGNFDFKSDKFLKPTIEEAIEQFKSCLKPFMKPLVTDQAASASINPI